MQNSSQYSGKILGRDNELTESISKKLIHASLVKDSDVVVLNQKLMILNLQNYTGNYFLDANNECLIRCFNNTPNLLAVICEYTLDTEISEAMNVENLLKNSLCEIGYTIIKT